MKFSIATTPDLPVYPLFNPVLPSKVSSKALAKLLDEHVLQFYDSFTTKEESSFSSLGKYHVEGGGEEKEGDDTPPSVEMPSTRWGSKLVSELPTGDFDFDLVIAPPRTTVLHIDGEELWNSDDPNERNRFLDGLIEALNKHGRLFLEGHAGFGKSHYVKMLIDRLKIEYVILSPYGSLIQKVWKNYTCMTDAKAFGQTVNKETQELETKRGGKQGGFDFSTIKLLVCDEAYLCQLTNIYRIQRLMKQYPSLRVIFIG